MSTATDAQVTPSSGNVFADLGLPEPEVRLAKAELARQIDSAISGRRLSRGAAARLLGLTASDLAALIEGRLSAFSVETLAHYLTVLGMDVQIVVSEKPANAPAGRLSVVTA